EGSARGGLLVRRTSRALRGARAELTITIAARPSKEVGRRRHGGRRRGGGERPVRATGPGSRSAGLARDRLGRYGRRDAHGPRGPLRYALQAGRLGSGPR